MRILMATPYFAPKVGGLEHYAESIARNLIELGWEVHVVTSGERTEIENIDGITVHRLKSTFVMSNMPVGIFWPFQIQRLIGRIRPDVINVHAPLPSMALATALVAGRVPLVVTYHAGSIRKGIALADMLIHIYEHMFLPVLLRRANHIICASDFVKNSFLVDWGYKSSTITPGVNSELFMPAARSHKPNRIVFIGDFRDPRKGLSVLREAVRTLPVTVHVIGPGTPVPQPRMKYLGIMRGSSVVHELQAADILVLPSTSEAESFGMVLIEAMATGTPVIGSAIGGIPYVIENGVDGLLVPTNDATSLKTAISLILDDPIRAARMGESGRRKVVNHYTWFSRAEKTQSVMLDALGSVATSQVQNG